MLACDFCVVVTAGFRILYVLVVMGIGSRRLVHFNVTGNPTAAWTLQQIGEFLAEEHPYRFVLHDRDAIYAPRLDEALAAMGVRVLRTPVQVPQANAFCERLIGSLRRECLDFLIPLGEGHLRRILGSGRITTTAAARMRVSVRASLSRRPGCRRLRFSGIDFRRSTTSWRDRFWAGSITNMAWRRWRREARFYFLRSTPDAPPRMRSWASGPADGSTGPRSPSVSRWISATSSADSTPCVANSGVGAADCRVVGPETSLLIPPPASCLLPPVAPKADPRHPEGTRSGWHRIRRWRTCYLLPSSLFFPSPCRTHASFCA